MRGNWFTTYSGRKFYLLDPRIEDIDIEDIAHALSNVCRWSGHVRRFYSVAEHSIHVSALLPPELALEGLLHDATEAYMLDMPRPVKHMPEMQVFRKYESQLEQVIAWKFGLPYPHSPAVKQADNIMLGVEARALMARAKDSPEWDWMWEGVIPHVDLQLYPSGYAEQPFLERFETLWRLRQQNVHSDAACSPASYGAPCPL